MNGWLTLLVAVAMTGCGAGAAEAGAADGRDDGLAVARADGAPPGAAASSSSQSSAEPPEGAASPSAVDPPLPRAEVVVVPARGTPIRLSVEVARTPRAQEHGLMHREHLAPNEGMLFVYDAMEHRSFWMKDTLIPLDMIFIDDQLEVVGFVEDAEPHTQDSREIPHPSQYVLEVAAGFCREHGIEPGNRVHLLDVAGHGATP